MRDSHDRGLARLVAALFVVTMLMGMVDAYAAAPVLRGPVVKIHDAAATVTLGALLRVFMSIGVVGIALAFFPVVRRSHETIAVSYVAFRTAEAVLLCLGACGHLVLIGLSRTAVDAGIPDDGALLAMRDGILRATRATYQIAMTLLGIAGTLQAWVLLRARLVPAFIAGLGILGYVLLLASAILDFVGLVDTLDGSGAMLYIPGGLFELVVLPAWLWSRGFRRDERAPARTRSAPPGAAVVVIAIFLAGLLAAAQARADAGWAVLDRRDGDDAWILFTRDKPGSKFVEYRIAGIVDAPPLAAEAAARTILVEATYLPEGAKRTILRSNDREIVSHSRFALPGPLSDREVTLRIEPYELPSGRRGLRWTSAPELGPPASKGVVRMPESSGHWEFTATGDGRSHATCVMHGDLGGHIPGWMVNGLAGKALVTDLGHIRQIVRARRSAGAVPSVSPASSPGTETGSGR